MRTPWRNGWPPCRRCRRRIRRRAWPRSRFRESLAPFRSHVFLLAKGREVNAKSIMGVMLLAAGPGTAVKVGVDGYDEAAAMAVLVALFEKGF